MRPLIGITSQTFTNHNGWVYDLAYTLNSRAVELAGGLPVLVPCGLAAETLRGIYERLDAVLLPGGGDVDPNRYDESPHPTTAQVDPARDDTEMTIARWAVEDDRPVLGICRGLQVMNVALGGSLIQDIPSLVRAELHPTPDFSLPRNRIAHQVRVEADSRLASILGATALAVNSMHHQCVSRPAAAARVVAHSPDGIVEALEVPDKHFVLAVQWHPEDMPDDVHTQRLFRAFVSAAREWSARV